MVWFCVRFYQLLFAWGPVCYLRHEFYSQFTRKSMSVRYSELSACHLIHCLFGKWDISVLLLHISYPLVLKTVANQPGRDCNILRLWVYIANLSNPLPDTARWLFNKINKSNPVLPSHFESPFPSQILTLSLDTRSSEVREGNIWNCSAVIQK